MNLLWNVEPLTPELIAETVPIQQGYWEEVAGPFHSYPPDVDWKTYLMAQEKGCLKVICGRNVRNGAAELKAGAFIVITPHPHYACIAASLPLLFVAPEYRHGREGLRLVRMAEEEAVKAGAQILMTHGGVHNGVYKLFEFMRYQDFGRYFVKVIGDSKPVFKEQK
jgi:GNAT superfamily N-acetyltransferase